jgi:starch synthase (maltosyl-transferring)
VRPGSEEYLDSEKYQLRPRDWAAAEESGQTLAPLIGLLNHLRRRHPALHGLRSLTFHHCDNEQVIAFSKHSTPPGRQMEPGQYAEPESDTVIVVVNLDPNHAHEATVTLDAEDLRRFGLTPAQAEGRETFPVRDELTGRTYDWSRSNYVRLAPGNDSPVAAHIFTLRPHHADARDADPKGTHP